MLVLPWKTSRAKANAGAAWLPLLLAACTLDLPAAELLPPVASLLDSQTTIRTWSADFVQTRHLKTLTRPLTATGRVWFAAPDQFRWELGQPARTIAIRSSNNLVMIYPVLKRVERYRLDDTQPGPWRDASALLEAGFPRNRADLERQFEVLSQSQTNHAVALALRPKSATARRMMPRIVLTLDTVQQQLLSTELEFADGSHMHNAFTNQETNKSPPEAAFSTKTPEGYEVVEPAKPAP